MVTYITGDRLGGGGRVDVMNVIHCGGSGSAPLRVGVVGYVPANWEGTERIQPSDDTVVDRGIPHWGGERMCI